MRIKTKPIELEAIQFTGTNIEEVRRFIGKETLASDLSIVVPFYSIERVAQKGDYIIKLLPGAFFPCESDTFKKQYEVIDG
ncbi:hypothetical protein [Streptococcus uberis]|uniref:hypothetical protein n=1 Tax=Streptococcus uberis TaxID=1349 RepID=UPI001FF4ECED|nr:hypothetical protein [Streptococcus uberis]MCK1213199.1 hypothetical protein [Streptococcus uberis]MCK1239833.1 hypothetical protein [Streptococcus uberis]